MPCVSASAWLTTSDGSTGVTGTMLANAWIAASMMPALLLAGATVVTPPVVVIVPQTVQQLCMSTARRLTKRELVGAFKFIFGIAY